MLEGKAATVHPCKVSQLDCKGSAPRVCLTDFLSNAQLAKLFLLSKHAFRLQY